MIEKGDKVIVTFYKYVDKGSMLPIVEKVLGSETYQSGIFVDFGVSKGTTVALVILKGSNRISPVGLEFVEFDIKEDDNGYGRNR